MNEIGWDNITIGMKRALACPILKLFRFATGDYEGSGLVDPNASQDDLNLMKKLGPGTHTITMDQNMLPYISYSEIGSGTALGVDNEIDLFIPIQEKMREITGNPNFIILPEERGTKYKLKKVGADKRTRPRRPVRYSSRYHNCSTSGAQGR
jgi:hypothetical protein